MREFVKLNMGDRIMTFTVSGVSIHGGSSAKAGLNDFGLLGENAEPKKKKEDISIHSSNARVAYANVPWPSIHGGSSQTQTASASQV